jgi:pseudouridine-5'-phosphate glycosidase
MKGPTISGDSVFEWSEKGKPVVALESTVISHGLPPPINIETAVECEDAIGALGATAATVGIVAGTPRIGLSRDELRVFAEGRAPDGSPIEKVSVNNLGIVVARKQWGATTVAGSIWIATLAGQAFDATIRRDGHTSEDAGRKRPLVFSTGGIGGVHRGAETTLDISADLAVLASAQIVCCCAGAKAILDLAKTKEVLETAGVPVIGFQTAEFPAFYSRSSGIPVDAAVDSPDEVAEIAHAHWRCGGRGAVLLCVPVPAEAEVPGSRLEPIINAALEKAERQGVTGKAVTPFLLAEVAKASGGETLTANRALLVNNAKVAAQVAVSVSRLIESGD